MHALRSPHLRSASGSRTLQTLHSSLTQPCSTARIQRRSTTTVAAARPCCCSAADGPGLSSQGPSLTSNRRGYRVVARDSPYREDPGAGSSTQDADVEQGAAADTPTDSSSSSSSSSATVSNSKASLPTKAAKAAATPHGSTPQAMAAAQALQRNDKLPKKIDAPAGQKLHAQLEEMSSKYQALEERLDAMEGNLISLLRSVKEKAARPAAAAAVGPAGEAAADGSAVAGDANGNVDLFQNEFSVLDTGDDDEQGGKFDLKKLQTSLTENINRGYLESVKHMREMLMAYEWHLHGKELAEKKGVALFERHCAENDLAVSFDTLTALYEEPNDLSVLGEDKLKLLARSIIQTAVDERYCNIYFECTKTAKELAHTGLKDVIPDSAGKVGGVIKDFLPLPGFLKK